MELLATFAEHAVASGCRVGAPAFGGADLPVERQLSDLENTLALIKLDPAENVPLLAPLLEFRSRQNPGQFLRAKNYAADNWRR